MRQEKEKLGCLRIPCRLRSLDRVANTLIGVELSDLWRLHLVYAKKDGKELITLVTSRFATLTTMLTLLVGSQVGTLFSPSRPTETVRTALETRDVGTVEFWAGFSLCLGILSSILSLVVVLTARALFVAIAPENAHIVLRTSVCLYAATLPVRMALISVYIFILWLNIFFFVVCSWETATALTAVCVVFLFHLTSMYSAVGRMIMLSGAIGTERILDPDVEDDMSPTDLSVALIEKSLIAKHGHVPVSEQYKIKYQEQLEILEEGGTLHLSELRLPEYQDSHDEGDSSKSK